MSSKVDPPSFDRQTLLLELTAKTYCKGQSPTAMSANERLKVATYSIYRSSIGTMISDWAHLVIQSDPLDAHGPRIQDCLQYRHATVTLGICSFCANDASRLTGFRGVKLWELQVFCKLLVPRRAIPVFWNLAVAA